MKIKIKKVGLDIDVSYYLEGGKITKSEAFEIEYPLTKRKERFYFFWVSLKDNEGLKLDKMKEPYLFVYNGTTIVMFTIAKDRYVYFIINNPNFDHGIKVEGGN